MRLASYIFATLLLAPRLEASVNPDFSGTWEGTANHQPAITLFIHEDGGVIRGEITFYTQSSDTDGTWRVADRFTTPIISPKVKKNSLIFHAQYYKSRRNSDLGDFRFEMTLGGPGTSIFRNLEHSHKAVPLKLERQQTAMRKSD